MTDEMMALRTMLEKGTDADVLRDVALTIAPGETVALVGL